VPANRPSAPPASPQQSPRQAFADESFHEVDQGGFYVLAAAVFDGEDHDMNRQAMVRLRAKQGGRRVNKLHWNEMNAQRRRDAVMRVADLAGFHVVAVGAPVPRRRQERARAMCLTQLVLELHSYQVHTLLMESRTETLDRRDVRTVTGARYLLPKGSRFRVEHLPGAAEPLFWVADIVAGAVRTHREGEPRYRRILEEYVYEIYVDTRC
jgi:hypothetical protein